jgi:hypothetical protein
MTHRERGKVMPHRAATHWRAEWYTKQKWTWAQPVSRLGRLTLGAALLMLLLLAHVGYPQAKSEGTMTWGLHFSIAPTFFDPAETTGLATPFLFLYALHDALIKPMPDGLLSPCLAESW